MLANDLFDKGLQAIAKLVYARAFHGRKSHRVR